MNHVSMDLVRVTEAAAIAASAWIGTGEALNADRAATEAMRDRLDRIDFAARVAIGEGKKDQSPGLFGGTVVGLRRDDVLLHGREPNYEICVDPIEGTRPTVTSGPEAISALGVSAGEGMLLATDSFYALKLAYGPRIAEKAQLSIEAPLSETLALAARAQGKPVEKMVVCVLDRARHQEVISELRRHRVRIKLIQDGDVSGALATCLPDSGVDLLYGVGGAPEAVLAACALKCLGGGMQVQLADNDGRPRPGRVLYLNDLVHSSCVFVATGITGGSLLRGVRFTERGAVTHSVFMRSTSRTIRWMTTEHGN